MPVRRRFMIALRLRTLRPGAWVAFSVALSALLAGSGCNGPDIHTAAHSPETTDVLMPPPPKPSELLERTAPQIADDAIEPGDVLEVTIAAGLSAEDIITLPSRVTDEGFLPLPEIGPVLVSGLTLPEAEKAIHRASIVRRLYRDPLVTVIRKTMRPHHVTVSGAVTDAGTYPLPPGSRDLVSAIRAAGGLAEDAGTEVEVMLPKPPQVAIQNPAIPASHFASSSEPNSPRTVQISLTTDRIGNEELPHGTIVRVKPRAKSSVQVLGLVRRPGSIEFSQEEDFRVLDAIALAGGLGGPNASRAVIVRHADEAAPLILQSDLKTAAHDSPENLPLMPGDVIHVEEPPRRRFGLLFPTLPWTIWTSEP